jgi:hypothetical protein
VRVYNNIDLLWKGNELRLKGRTIVEIVEDSKYPGMWRVKKPDGSLTDMVNITRARDAARGLALGILNTKETDAGAV